MDRPRGMFTPADRAFLLGETEFENDQSERDARYRIRQRAIESIRDFRILVAGLDPADIERVANEVTDEDLRWLQKVADFIDRLNEIEDELAHLQTERERMLGDRDD